jgi:hypothetical protein
LSARSRSIPASTHNLRRHPPAPLPTRADATSIVARRDGEVILQYDGTVRLSGEDLGVGAAKHSITLVGWKAGLEPLVDFDTTSYLAAYPDVAAANVNPLVHALAFGQREDCSPFADGVWGSLAWPRDARALHAVGRRSIRARATFPGNHA